MKILFLNVYQGIPEPEREEQIRAFLKRENPDVCGLAELNGWEKNTRFASFAQKAGFPYHLLSLSSQSSYHVGLLAKYPLERKALAGSFRNAALAARIVLPEKKITAIVLHLHPRSEDDRLSELQNILTPDPHHYHHSTLLLGDFNALSPEDEYPPEMLSLLKNKGITKFGISSLRKEVIQKTREAGFVDTARHFSPLFTPTAPTHFITDPAHALPCRLDYIFCTEDLVPFLKAASTLRTPETNMLSDHYPVRAELSFHNS